jgi:CHAT domain-containing protein
LNIGIVYFHLNDFPKALTAFQKSIALKEKYRLPGKENVYLNLARTYAKTGNNLMADKYFNLSIFQSRVENKNFSVILVNIYLEYGHFLMSINANDKALIPIQNALNLSLKNIGEKNHLTSNCYQLMGDYYLINKDYPNALINYQNTLISGYPDFNDHGIGSNPVIGEILPNLWQLRVLQCKAEVLALLAEEKDKPDKIEYLKLSLKAFGLAIEMTNKIRGDYHAEETRLTFNEKQKDVYVEAMETNLKLYEITGEKGYLQLAYQTAQQSKANELKFEIARNNSLSSNDIPDSLRTKEKEIQSNIAAYSTLIRNESLLQVQDTTKIAYWKDQQFDLSRVLEKTIDRIEREYPRFTDKLNRGNIIPTETIQTNLKPQGTLIEYVFSETDINGNRKLYEFVITPKDIMCHTELIDSTMSANLSDLTAQSANQFTGINTLEKYNSLNYRLYKAYTILIKPLEKYFKGKQLIIIPDEELSFLPFDAFLTTWVKKSKINYAELAFLIRDYSISYSYSTNTLWNYGSKAKFRPKVIGFAPDYENSSSVGFNTYNSLKNNTKEVKSILNNFNGKILEAGQATIANFRANSKGSAVLHLAMHAELDTLQAGSSSLIFTPDSKNRDNYRLYNYEIGQMAINSPMVVLSACNTGNGRLYSGEGLMSLARNFVLAGVPSVVETLWPVQDVAGSKIMGDFYKYLAEGNPKNTSMRLAKLDYINNTSPSFVNPGYWAAYTLMGDVSAIKKIWWKEPWIIIILTLSTIFLIVLLIYRLSVLRISRAFFL